MINAILTAAGIEYRRGRFPKPPEGTYIVFFDDQEVDGPDPVGYTAEPLPRIVHHSIRVELYASAPDPEAEASLEAQLNARGLPWTKEDLYWLQDEQRYQTLYEFDYTTKN